MRYCLLLIMSSLLSFGMSGGGCSLSGCFAQNVSQTSPKRQQGEDVQHLYVLNGFNEVYIHSTIVKDSFRDYPDQGISWEDIHGDSHIYILSKNVQVYIGPQADFSRATNFVDLDR